MLYLFLIFQKAFPSQFLNVFVHFDSNLIYYNISYACFSLNLFVPNASILCLLKTSENRKGDRKRVHWEQMGNRVLMDKSNLKC